MQKLTRVFIFDDKNTEMYSENNSSRFTEIYIHIVKNEHNKF